jgi:hypothetical protein
MENLNNLILALIRQAGFTNAAQDRRFSPLIFLLLFPSPLPPFSDFAIAIPRRVILTYAFFFWRDILRESNKSKEFRE